MVARMQGLGLIQKHLQFENGVTITFKMRRKIVPTL